MIDPIAAEIILQGLAAIPNLIDKDITRTAFSFLISEYKDYATGIVDADARLVTQCRGGLPIFCANALCAAVQSGLDIYGKAGLRSGDVIITNEAATMGQHLNNVVMYTPIRVDESDDGLIGFMVVVMHWMDVGGRTIGSSGAPDSTDVFQEGIQFPTLRLHSQGARQEEIYRLIRANTRFPLLVLGDVDAQVAGCLMGRDMVLALVGRHGPAAIRAAIAGFWARSERAVRDAISATPDGTYRASAFLDDDGVNLGAPLPIEVAVIVAGEDVTIDLSGVAPQVQGPLNAGYQGGAVAAARIACKYVFSPHEPANDGAFRPLRVLCPPGTFLSANATAPIGGSGFMIPTVVDTILRAFAQALPGRIPAAHHGTYGIHMIDGRMPGTGEWFQTLESSAGGWGAARHRDGTGPFRSNAHGDTKEVPVELQEASYPLLFDHVRLRPDSGGAGRNRGGLGIEKSYRVLAEARLTASMERTQCPPWGLEGGQSAEPGTIQVHRATGEVLHLTKKQVPLSPGDTIVVRTAGGGGYGPARERPPEAVRADLEAGYISPEGGARDYGFTEEDSP